MGSFAKLCGPIGYLYEPHLYAYIVYMLLLFVPTFLLCNLKSSTKSIAKNKSPSIGVKRQYFGRMMQIVYFIFQYIIVIINNLCYTYNTYTRGIYTQVYPISWCIHCEDRVHFSSELYLVIK